MWPLRNFGVPTRTCSSFSLLALLTMVTFKEVFGDINCFQCNSYTDSQCLELRSNDTTSKFYRPCEVDSEGRNALCRKIELYIAVTGERRVIRTCGWEVYPSQDCYKKEDDDHREIVCQCFTDGCNAASTLANNKELFTVLTTIISFIITKFIAS